MTDDHFPSESTHLPGDDDLYPTICPDCERRVTDCYGHRRDCPQWGVTTDPRPDRD